MKKDYILINGTLMHADDYLMHYGKKGMKWKRRKGMSTADYEMAYGREADRLGNGNRTAGLKTLHDTYTNRNDTWNKGVNSKKAAHEEQFGKSSKRSVKKGFAILSKMYAKARYNDAKANRTK